MPIEIAKIPLPRVHRIVTQEQADFISHRIPGMSGNVVQDMGRPSVRLQIEGIFYGKKAPQDLEALRKVFHARKPVDFLADIVGRAYFSQVVIEQLEVRQSAMELDQFAYQLTVVEFVPPPKASKMNKVSIDAKLALKSQGFMDFLKLPDLLSVPNFGDPTIPLQGVQTQVETTLSKAVSPTDRLNDLFEEKGAVTTEVQAAQQKVKTTAHEALKGFDASHEEMEQKTKNEVAKQLKAVETDLPTPKIPEAKVAALVQEPMNAVENQLTAQSEALVATTAVDLNKMLDNLEGQLIKDLNPSFEVFKSFAQPNPDTTSEPPPIVAPQLLQLPEKVSMQVFEAASQTDLQLEHLLEWCYEGLKRFPREAIPLQTVPILDELRDKLETILGWLQKDGKDCTDTFATSILEWSQSIQTAFQERTWTPIYIWLQNATEQAEKKALQAPLKGIVTPLENLIPWVQSGNWEQADITLSALRTQIQALSEENSSFQEIWFSAAVPQRSKLEYLNESLELEMGRILMLAAPPKPLNLLRLGLQPMQWLLNSQGMDRFLNSLNQVWTQADDFMKSLNLKSTQDFIHQTTATAEKGMLFVQDTLKTTFEKVKTGLATVQKELEQFQLQALKAQVKEWINETIQLFLEEVCSFLKPVTDFIVNTLRDLETLLHSFNAQNIVAEITKWIQEWTGFLRKSVEPVFQTAKTALTRVKDEINGFSIKPLTNPVIKGITIVQTGMDIIKVLPMPSSAQKKVHAALNKLPTATTFRAKVNGVSDGFTKMVETQVKTKLMTLQQKLITLEKEVNKFAPDQVFNDALFLPYDKLVKSVEEFKPSTLMQSVDQKLLLSHQQFKIQLQTMKIFEPLQPSLDSLIVRLNTLDFNKLVQPVQNTITEKVAAITKKLPLQQVARVMNQADAVTRRIEHGISVSKTVRIQLLHLNDALLHLKNLKVPAQALSQRVVSKWADLNTLEPLLKPLQALHDAIDLTTETKLSNAILPMLEKAFAQIQKYELQQDLNRIAEAQIAFSLEKVPDSAQKTELLTVLKDLNTALTPFNRLNQLSNDLAESQKNLKTTFETWQSLYHSEQSPLKRFQLDPKVAESERPAALKTMLQTMVQEQMEAVLTPIFSLGEQGQPLVATHLQKISSIMEFFNTQLMNVVNMERDVSKLFQSFQNFVYEINHIDIMFLPNGLDAISKAVQKQLKDFNLKEMDTFFKSSLTDTMLLFRPEAVFNNLFPAKGTEKVKGLAQLDGSHTRAVQQFYALHPKKLLREPLQKEFDKLKKELVIFEVKDTIGTFLDATGRLQKELKTELGSTADAYQKLMKSVPKSI